MSNIEQSIDIIKVLPKNLSCGYRICWKQISKDNIEIYIDKKGFKGGSKARPIRIKRFIPINALFFEGMGLWFGDGSKLSQGVEKVFGFTNNQIKLHEHFLMFSKLCLGINPSQFKARILLPERLSGKVEEIKREISDKLDIPIQNFNKYRIQKLNKTCLEIRIYSTLLGLVMSNLLRWLKENIFLDNKFIACFLRGLIASEGSINLGIRKRLEIISIAAKEKAERDFIKKLLLSLGIIPNKDGYATVLVTGLSNFRLLNKWKLCILHPDKFSQFVTGLKEIRQENFRKGECKLMILRLLSVQPRTVQELCKILNRTLDTIKTHHLIDLEKSGFVKRKGRKNNRRIWKITKEGLRVLQEENPLEILRYINFKNEKRVS